MAITSATFQSATAEPEGSTTYRTVVNLITNDARGTFQRVFFVTGRTQAELTLALRKQLAALVDAEAVKDVVITIPPGTNIPLTAPTVPPPTQAEIDGALWIADIRRLSRLTALGAFAAGALTNDIAALRVSVQSRYDALGAGVRAAYLAAV